MKWFQDLPIARKLAVGFTLTTLMTLVLGAFALLRLSEANAQLREMAGNDIPSVQHLGEARSQLGEFRTYELAQLSMLDQPEKVADYNKRMDDTAKAVHDDWPRTRRCRRWTRSVNCIAPPAAGSLLRRQQGDARSRGRR
jgi:methyl-accepting chemotaxis protein